MIGAKPFNLHNTKAMQPDVVGGMQHFLNMIGGTSINLFGLKDRTRLNGGHVLLRCLICLAILVGCGRAKIPAAKHRSLWSLASSTTHLCSGGAMVLGEEVGGWLPIGIVQDMPSDADDGSRAKGRVLSYRWNGFIRRDVEGFLYRWQRRLDGTWHHRRWLYNSKHAFDDAKLYASQNGAGFRFFTGSRTGNEYYLEQRFAVSRHSLLGHYVLVIHPDSGIQVIQELRLDSCQRAEFRDPCSKIPAGALDSLFKSYPRSSMHTTGYPSRAVFTMNLLSRALRRALDAGQGTSISIDLASKFPYLSYAYACLEPRGDSLFIHFPNATIGCDTLLNCWRVEKG